MQHEALYKLSPLLDQFKEGLCKMAVLRPVQQFPQLFLPLFTFTGNVSSEEVIAAIYPDPDEPVEDILQTMMIIYINGLSSEGKAI